METSCFVLIVMTIVQQLDGNLVYPNVIGKSLAIHPLTIMILLMVAGNLWGIIGMILIVPVYAVLRTILEFSIELFSLTKKILEKQQTDELKPMGFDSF